MSWVKDAEHWRDYGHTWGPGHEKEDYEEEDKANEKDEKDWEKARLKEDMDLASWYSRY